MIQGENATLVTYSAVFGQKEEQLRKFEVGEIEKYAQYDVSITIRGLNPGKRKWWCILLVPDDTKYAIIYDQKNVAVYDSREDVPCDMEKWKATKNEISQRHARAS